jgi:hypothetical protein
MASAGAAIKEIARRIGRPMSPEQGSVLHGSSRQASDSACGYHGAGRCLCLQRPSF